MAQQVSGSDKTLLEAIRDEEVPRPALQRWNEWQVWRSGPGRMPRMSTDGYSVTRAQESVLWKAVMLDLYGEDWSFQLVSAEAEAPDTADSTGAAGPAGPTEDPFPDSIPVGPGFFESPGSGRLTGVATPIPGASGVVSNPGSGVETPQSWSSQSPGTPGGLTQMVLRPFRPEAETLERYRDRVQRQAMALELAEAPLGEGVLDHLLSRAYYEDLVFTEARQDTAMQVRIIRREFAKEYVAGITGS